MTRFARAKGSKSSNERVPESATSWRDMKNDLLKKSDENDQTGESNSTRKSFSIDNKQEKVVKWSEFPFDEQQLKIKKSKSNKSKPPENETKVEKLENPPPGQKKRKRKAQTNNSEKSLINNETQSKNVVESESPPDTQNKRNKAVKKAGKRVDCSESTVDAAEAVQNATWSGSKAKQMDYPNNETINQKLSKKFQRFNRGQQHDFSTNTKTKAAQKQSFNKKNDHEEYKRRKPMYEAHKIYINGNEIEVAYYEGFPMKKIDADRIIELKKEMISKGLPKSEIRSALKLERRKGEKALARERKKVCFNCRRSGHILSECPALKSGSNAQLSETGICFKCGSTEHTHFECRVTRGDNFNFAQCFICKEQGHIARQCPDNNKGLYPKGGACRVCGDVTHLKKDCPKYQYEQEENKIVAHTIDDHNIESLETESKIVTKQRPNPQKIIKF